MPNGISRKTFEDMPTDDKLNILFDFMVELRSAVNKYAKIWGLIGGLIPGISLLIIFAIKGLF